MRAGPLTHCARRQSEGCRRFCAHALTSHTTTTYNLLITINNHKQPRLRPTHARTHKHINHNYLNSSNNHTGTRGMYRNGEVRTLTKFTKEPLTLPRSSRRHSVGDTRVMVAWFLARGRRAAGERARAGIKTRMRAQAPHPQSPAP